MVIQQGDLFWIDLGAAQGSAPGFRRPCVVVQNNDFNERRIQTTVICALTSNLRRATAPGNVLLHRNEAGLPNASVVNVSQMLTVDKSMLEDHIGTLSPARVRQNLGRPAPAFRAVTVAARPVLMPAARQIMGTLMP